jgi:hypothetical protein
LSESEFRDVRDKALPLPPVEVKVWTTVLWVLGFGVGFLVVVVLLPVVVEREAMVGVNGWLKGVVGVR